MMVNPRPNKYYTGSEGEPFIPDRLHAQAHACMQEIQYSSRLYICLYEPSCEVISNVVNVLLFIHCLLLRQFCVCVCVGGGL